MTSEENRNSRFCIFLFFIFIKKNHIISKWCGICQVDLFVHINSLPRSRHPPSLSNLVAIIHIQPPGQKRGGLSMASVSVFSCGPKLSRIASLENATVTTSYSRVSQLILILLILNSEKTLNWV